LTDVCTCGGHGCSWAWKEEILTKLFNLLMFFNE